MISASCQRTDYALHLQLEEHRGKLTDGDISLYGELVELEIAHFIEHFHDALFFVRQVREQMSLNAIGLSLL